MIDTPKVGKKLIAYLEQLNDCGATYSDGEELSVHPYVEEMIYNIHKILAGGTDNDRYIKLGKAYLDMMRETTENIRIDSGSGNTHLIP